MTSTQRITPRGDNKASNKGKKPIVAAHKPTGTPTVKTHTNSITTTNPTTPITFNNTTKNTPRTSASTASTKNTPRTTTTVNATTSNGNLKSSCPRKAVDSKANDNNSTNNNNNNSSQQLSALLARWDKGTKIVRQKILIEFLNTHKQKSGLGIEKEYGSGASLFLARLTASLRLTYNEGLSMSQLLRGIGVFVGSGELSFLVDFVQTGSLATILELLVLPEVSEDDKQDALALLLHIIAAGRSYKELVCLNGGHDVVVECMRKCTLPHTLTLCTTLLHALGSDNPVYAQPLQLALTSLLPSRSRSAAPATTPATDISLVACHAAAQTLHLLLTPPASLPPSPALTNPILSLLAIPNLAIHAEAASLIDILIRHEHLREEVLEELVGMTEEARGGQVMKQHHHVYINNVSLVRNGNINTSASYGGYVLRAELEASSSAGGSRLSSVGQLRTSSPDLMGSDGIFSNSTASSSSSGSSSIPTSNSNLDANSPSPNLSPNITASNTSSNSTNTNTITNANTNTTNATNTTNTSEPTSTRAILNIHSNSPRWGSNLRHSYTDLLSMINTQLVETRNQINEDNREDSTSASPSDSPRTTTTDTTTNPSAIRRLNMRHKSSSDLIHLQQQANNSPRNFSRRTSASDLFAGIQPPTNYSGVRLINSRCTSTSDLLNGSQLQHSSSINSARLPTIVQSYELLPLQHVSSSTNNSLRLLNHHHKSSSDLLSGNQLQHTTSPRLINSRHSSSSDLLQQSTLQNTDHFNSSRLSFQRTSSADFQLQPTSYTTANKRSSLSIIPPTLPPLSVSPTPSPPTFSSPSPLTPPLNNGSPRSDTRQHSPTSPSISTSTSNSNSPPIAPAATNKRSPRLLTLSPHTVSPTPSALGLATPTSPIVHSFSSTPSFAQSTAGLPVVTTTTHEATAMVMRRLGEEWGALLISHGAIPALISALVNTHHIPTLQQLSSALSLLCLLHAEGMKHLVDLVGDLAYQLTRGYPPLIALLPTPCAPSLPARSFNKTT